MIRLIRSTLLSIRDLALTAGPFALLGVALLAGAYHVLQPNPPRRVVLATGPEQSHFAAFGERYAAELKKFGIEVVLRGTGGAADNMQLLSDPAEAVDLAFIRGGSGESVRAIDEADSGVPLVSLGSLFFEPVWLFYREQASAWLPGATLTALAQTKGWRMNTGAHGSGVHNLYRKLLDANGLDLKALQDRRLTDTPAVIAFLAGELDAVVFVAAHESPMVQMLLRTPRVKLFEFPQAEAYARRYPYLSPVSMPRGVIDIAANLPPRDIPLLASTAMLAAREGTHPALLQLFVQAAHRIHGGAGWFARAGQFPSAQGGELHLAREAERFYRAGPPLLQRYLPFWLANLIDRMWVALVSIVAILIPLSRIVPPLYVMRIRARIYRWYRSLREIEESLGRKSASPSELLAALDRLEASAERIVVPLAYADELYRLRSHIELVRDRLRAQSAQG